MIMLSIHNILLHVYPILGTCIVIIRTNTEIVIGADSKRTIYAINRQTGEMIESIDDTYCKIKKVGDFFFAVSGYDDDKMHSNATASCTNSKTLQEVVEKFSASMKNDFENSVEFIRVKNLEKYVKRFTEKDVAQVSFFNIDKGKPQLITICFKAINKPDEKVTITTSLDLDERLTILGSSDFISNLSPEALKSIAKKGDHIFTVKEFITIQSKGRPNQVGGPIDIFKLDANGETWVSRKSNCN